MAGYNLVPHFFDYSNKSIQNLEKLKSMFGNEILRTVMKNVIAHTNKETSTLEISRVRIYEEIGETKEILQIILSRECEKVMQYRERYSSHRPQENKSDSQYDAY